MRPKRRARQRIHQADAKQAPGGDQVVDLDLRPEAPVEQAQQPGAVGRDAFLAAEERAQDQRARATSSASPSEIMANAVPLRLVDTQPNIMANSEPGQAADQRHHEQRDRQLAAPTRIDGVHREVGAEAVVNRMTERQHAGLAEQHVVGQREDDGDAHQAHHRQRRAGARRAAAAPPAAAPRRSTIRAAQAVPTPRLPPPSTMRAWHGIAHVSRFPNRPVGRKIRTSTSSR